MENNESPELIEKEMQATRNSLTEKVSLLENQVMGTMHSASEAVQTSVEAVKDTVDNVRSTMEETVSTVKDSVRQAFDFSSHVRENPWPMMGGAIAVGFVAGWFAGGSRRDSQSDLDQDFRPLAPPPQAAYTPPAEPRKPSWVDKLMERAGDELQKLGEMALAQATQSLQQAVNQNVPKLIDQVQERIMGNGESHERPQHAPYTTSG